MGDGRSVREDWKGQAHHTKKKENKIKQNKSFSNNYLKPLQWNQEANN